MSGNRLKKYGCWLSKEISGNFKRIACVELLDYHNREKASEECTFLKRAFSTFRFLLEQAEVEKVDIHSVALPIRGAGFQKIEDYFILPPLVTQCLNALKSISDLETITFFEYRRERAERISEYLNKILNVQNVVPASVFISYSSKQYEIAKTVFDYLTRNGISCWMAPDSIPIGSDYQEEIPIALSNISSLILLLTKDVEESRWVKKEVGTAVGANKKILPIQLEPFELGQSFRFLLEGEQIKQVWKVETMQWLKQIKNEVEEKSE